MSRRAAVGESKRAPLNMRTTPELRDKLEAAAEARGLSLTQEVVRRIEQSFELEEKLNLETSRAASNFVGRLIRSAVDAVEAKTEKKWKDDARTAAICEGTVAGVAEAIMRPFLGDLKVNKLMNEDAETVRKELFESGRQFGRVYALDRLSDQVKKLDESAWSD